MLTTSGSRYPCALCAARRRQPEQLGIVGMAVFVMHDDVVEHASRSREGRRGRRDEPLEAVPGTGSIRPPPVRGPHLPAGGARRARSPGCGTPARSRCRGRRRRWPALVAAAAQRGHGGSWASSGTSSSAARSTPPPAPNTRSACRRHGAPRHVLDHAAHGQVDLAAIAADRRATFCAAGCGVVTTYTSPRGRYWRQRMAMSPVPGGMSTIRNSGRSSRRR